MRKPVADVPDVKGSPSGRLSNLLALTAGLASHLAVVGALMVPLACGSKSTSLAGHRPAGTFDDSTATVVLATDAFWGDREPRYPLHVVAYTREEIKVTITFYPDDPLIRGGGGVVEVRADGTATVIERFH